jgi:hypothetical protein
VCREKEHQFIDDVREEMGMPGDYTIQDLSKELVRTIGENMLIVNVHAVLLTGGGGGRI